MQISVEHILFAAEIEPAEPFGRRRASRTPVSLDAKIGRGGLDRTLCKVTDLSIDGCRLQTYSALRRGAMIWVTLPGARPRIARIRWADDYEAGCEFEEQLDRGLYATLTEL
jgi:hypothetical protein